MKPEALIGRKVAGRFAIKRLLGEGGMATVYVAERDAEPRLVALKVMNPELTADRAFVRRFQREAKAASRVKHPNSVKIFEYGVEGPLSYIVMELLVGHDLYTLLEQHGALSQARAARILAEVCDALAVAHEMGIVHRDLKPENIMVIPDPTHPYGERVKVLDFGIAKVLEADTAGGDEAAAEREPNSAVTRVGTLIGTPAYMSPEQCSLLPIDTRADIYTCGVLLFQLVTGRLPFEGETPLHTATLHIHSPVPAPSTFAPGIDPRLDALIVKALAKKPGDRQQTARHLGASLRKILQDLPDVAASTGPISRRQESALWPRDAAVATPRGPTSVASMESARTLVSAAPSEGGALTGGSGGYPAAQAPAPAAGSGGYPAAQAPAAPRPGSGGYPAAQAPAAPRPGSGGYPAAPPTAAAGAPRLGGLGGLGTFSSAAAEPARTWGAPPAEPSPLRPLELPPKDPSESDSEESTLTLLRPSTDGRDDAETRATHPDSPDSRDMDLSDSSPAIVREAVVRDVKTTLRSADDFKLRGAPPRRIEVVMPGPAPSPAADPFGPTSSTGPSSQTGPLPEGTGLGDASPKRVIQTIRMANPNVPVSSPLPAAPSREGSSPNLPAYQPSGPSAARAGAVPLSAVVVPAPLPGMLQTLPMAGVQGGVNPLAPTAMDLPNVPVPLPPPEPALETGWMSGRRGLLVGFLAGMVITAVFVATYLLFLR